MARMSKVGSAHTTVTNVDGVITTTYHATEVCQIDTDKRTIRLRSGGYLSVTTKARINQTINQYLGYGCAVSLYQDRGDWFVMTPDGVIPFEENMTIRYDQPEATDTPE